MGKAVIAHPPPDESTVTFMRHCSLPSTEPTVKGPPVSSGSSPADGTTGVTPGSLSGVLRMTLAVPSVRTISR